MKTILAAAFALMPVIGFADGHDSPMGDAEAGARLFDRQCQSCHVVVNDDGERLAGRTARTGPNLFAVAGRVPGSVDGFRYGAAIIALGETGLVWTEADFVAYTQNPTGWLRETLDDSRARGKMSFRVRSEQDALDIYAFIYGLAAPAE
ncbi:MAG: cytochrome C [Rhodobacteraceae bacterium]|nr:cytochrome C [Paracoccaceae bacterium]